MRRIFSPLNISIHKGYTALQYFIKITMENVRELFLENGTREGGAGILLARVHGRRIHSSTSSPLSDIDHA